MALPQPVPRRGWAVNVTTHYRYQRPPGKRMSVTIKVPEVVTVRDRKRVANRTNLGRLRVALWFLGTRVDVLYIVTN